MERQFINWEAVYDSLRLPDGRKAWPVAQSLGMDEATFRGRLRVMCVERAVFEPVKRHRSKQERCVREAHWQGVFRQRRKERLYDPFDERLHEMGTLEDGRSAWSVAMDNGVSPVAFRMRLRRGWSLDQAAGKPRPRRWLSPGGFVSAAQH